jgi:hypothetical protein
MDSPHFSPFLSLSLSLSSPERISVDRFGAAPEIERMFER